MVLELHFAVCVDPARLHRTAQRVPLPRPGFGALVSICEKHPSNAPGTRPCPVGPPTHLGPAPDPYVSPVCDAYRATFGRGVSRCYAHVSRTFRVFRAGCYTRFAHVSRYYAHVSRIFHGYRTGHHTHFAHVSRCFTHSYTTVSNSVRQSSKCMARALAAPTLCLSALFSLSLEIPCSLIEALRAGKSGGSRRDQATRAVGGAAAPGSGAEGEVGERGWVGVF